LGRRFFRSVTMSDIVYMTFFPNDVIRKFSTDFDDTLPIQYQESKLINIVLLYIMPICPG